MLRPAFALSQVLGVAAQRAIADMRTSMQRHITRLPTSYFDSTQTGVLISRVMNDAEGIRNLVGSGLVQLVGGLVTAVIALAVLFYLNWQLTLISIVVLAVFAAGMIVAFRKLRPLFRDRGKITCGNHRAAWRVVRRHPHRQGLHRRRSRRSRLCRWRSPALSRTSGRR